MQPPPLVTVVIPTYDDDPEHLAAALASVVAQTHPRLEIVVVDDGSKPPVDIASLRAGAPVNVIRQPNAGPAAARNTGIHAGRGHYVLCLDADDLVSPTYVAEAVQLLEEDPARAVVYAGLVPFGELDAPGWPTRGELSLEHFAQRSAVPVASMFRRADWAATSGWDEGMRTGMEDHEWWVRLLGATGGVAAPMPCAVLSYRVRPGSRSRTRPYAEDLAVTREHILANNPPRVLRQLLRGAWAATDAAELEAALAWSDRWQLRRWGRAVRRRLRRVLPGRSATPPSGVA
ncbi:hypothetical protein ASG73_08070 [Janibacter sp. Soil728]|uniref:glycosyltransferase family 2 protein n=1 Tax=Janibacter sp. Soil728 TaxID=1736393 RepID=UPI0006FD8CD4|nr:glycosyltransferase family A protein [Janibacter sp. Soil728]KRE37607.1 hypothetical protein ASG73_08070 [Janibacter sp. Soil728]